MSKTQKELLATDPRKNEVDQKRAKEGVAHKKLDLFADKYPKLIIVTKMMPNNTVEVQFTVHNSADRPTVISTKMLSNTEPLHLPGDNHAGKISLNANGSISIEGQLNTYLKIKTDNNIEISKPLNTKGLSVDANAVLINSNLDCNAGVLELSSKNYIHNHGTISANERVIMNARSFENTQSIISDKINIELSTINKQKYGKFKNAGNLIGVSHLSIKSKGDVINTESGHLLSKGKLTVRTGSEFRNNSIIYGKTGVYISSGRVLENKGKISSDWIDLSSSDEIQNAGTVFAGQKLVINSIAVNNLVNGKLCSLGTILAAVTHCFKNVDTVVAVGKLTISSDRDIINDITGIIASELEKIHFVSLQDMNNAGKISAYTHVSITTGKNVTNAANASICAKEILTLISLKYFNNLGSLFGGKSVDIKSYGEAFNGKSGSLLSFGDMIFSAFEDLINAGLAEANNILAQSYRSLQNTESGALLASDTLQMKARDGIINAGLGRGQEVQVAAPTVHNTESGALLASKKLLLEASQNIINAGLAKGYRVDISTRTLKNTGVISSLTELSMLIDEVLEHCRKGTLHAEKAISILTENLYLMGELIAKGDFNATIKNGFDYNPDTFKVYGILRLCLLEGYDFRKPINTFGSFEIASPRNIQILTPLRTQQNFSISSQNLSVIKDGVVALGTLAANIQEHLQTMRGAHLVSQGNMQLKLKRNNTRGMLLRMEIW